MAMVRALVKERPVVIFSKSSCCMSYTIKTLISSFGANPRVYEVDEHPQGKQIEKELRGLGCKQIVPAVFIGEELIGGANEIMSLHLKGQLSRWVLQFLQSAEKPVVIFSKSSCSMCHSIKTLIGSYGANATVYEIDEDPKGHQMERELKMLDRSRPSVPAVFIGHELVGGPDEIMSLQLKGKLVDLLKKANAIWV
ncbi:unnamed protein product [Lactuca saligna]|uniref:Glutaredoxin domain-containing protein n=1 Tax=Lactuca saligna TaxID=75948 RepID=A0AA36EHG6_LACSI|nr:unnamed protein product [Lactuca saligna]